MLRKRGEHSDDAYEVDKGGMKTDDQTLRTLSSTCLALSFVLSSASFPFSFVTPMISFVLLLLASMSSLLLLFPASTNPAVFSLSRSMTLGVPVLGAD
jgi:hypothetical protein